MQRSTVHLGLASNDACDGHKQRPARSPWVFHYTMWTCITDGRSYPFMIAGKELVSGETWRSVGELLSSSSGRVNCIALDIRTVTWNYPAKNTKPRRHYVSPVQDGCLFFQRRCSALTRKVWVILLCHLFSRPFSAWRWLHWYLSSGLLGRWENDDWTQDTPDLSEDFGLGRRPLH